jgi:hypothetical protein
VRTWKWLSAWVLTLSQRAKRHLPPYTHTHTHTHTHTDMKITASDETNTGREIMFVLDFLKYPHTFSKIQWVSVWHKVHSCSVVCASVWRNKFSAAGEIKWKGNHTCIPFSKSATHSVWLSSVSSCVKGKWSFYTGWQWIKKENKGLSFVFHTCNPSYWGEREQRSRGPPFQASLGKKLARGLGLWLKW